MQHNCFLKDTFSTLLYTAYAKTVLGPELQCLLKVKEDLS